MMDDPEEADPPLDAGGGTEAEHLGGDTSPGDTEDSEQASNEAPLVGTNNPEQSSVIQETAIPDAGVDQSEATEIESHGSQADGPASEPICEEGDHGSADNTEDSVVSTSGAVDEDLPQRDLGRDTEDKNQDRSAHENQDSPKETSATGGSNIEIVVTDSSLENTVETECDKEAKESGGAEQKDSCEIEPEMSSIDLNTEESETTVSVSVSPASPASPACDDQLLSGDNSSNAGQSHSATNSERSSMTASPTFEPVSVPAESAENRTALENMAGDIQSAIDRSFAMLESDTPSVADSASDSGPYTPPSELSSDVSHANGSTASNNTSSHSTPLHNRAVLDIRYDSPNRSVQQQQQQQPSHCQGVVSADASVVQLGEEETICEAVVTETLPVTRGSQRLHTSGEDSSSANGFVDETDQLLSELDAELDSPDDGETFSVVTLPNGLHQTVNLENIPEHKDLRRKYESLQKQLQDKHLSLQRASDDQRTVSAWSARLSEALRERDECRQKLESQRDRTTEDIYLVQTKELEFTIARQNREIQQVKEKLHSHDQAAKRAINTLQSELKSKVDQVTKMYTDARKEKESMVMNYAQAEQKNIKLQSEMSRVEQRMKDMNKEKEIFMNRFRNLKMEKQKMSEVFDSKGAEMAAMRRELERHREGANSLDTKAKWAQNKLKSELNAHKETKARLEEANKKIRQSKEETEQIRRDCQAIIKTYQTSEEIKSNSLDTQLKKTEVQLQQEKQEKTDQEEVHFMIIRELENLKKKHKELLDEAMLYRDKIQCLEAERMVHEETMRKFKETLQNQKTANQEMNVRLQELEQVDNRLIAETQRADRLQAKVEELEEDATDLVSDMEKCSKRESEHLDFTQKISDKNARLQSENTTLNKELSTVSAERDTLSTQCASLEKSVKHLESSLAEVKQSKEKVEQGLTAKLQTKEKEVNELAIMLGDERSANKTLKKKHNANVKDLTRQLQQYHRKMDGLERDSTSMGSMGSRTSSNNSLDTVAGQHQHANSRMPIQNMPPPPAAPPQEEYPPFVEVVEVDKQMLMDKIVRLQKAHARKNEKMEFMEDHINQLSTEVKKKTKLIQHYVMMMDAGTVTPESSDLNKAHLTKKGGIMASLYSHHQQDGAMNLDLSLEINHKIQAVLEDTLLKNITLKENLDTLGQEIARLSQENRRIQLQLQGDHS